MIQITDLTKQYSRNQPPAVRNLSLEINDGEIMGFAGLNGAGKTTTIRIVCGIIFPTGGKVLVNGKDIVREKVAASKHIGWVPELPNFEPTGKSVQLLKYYAGFYGIPPKEAEAKAETLLKKFNIWDARKRPLKDYSQGMKKRFSIAAAMMGDPDNFLFDETLNGLDPEGVKNMRDFMLSLKKEGKAVFLSSHILSELENVADRIAIIKRGEIVKVVERSELSNLGELSVKIVLQKADDNAVSLLQQFGKPENSGNEITLRSLNIPSDEVYKVSEALFKAGYRVISISTESEGLEDYFLELVGSGK
ncbi:MAG: ABC transporter ATP-binding protein [Thermoplasmataceae archaeon]|jgi:ABC-2 type transport system ATP-binding protein